LIFASLANAPLTVFVLPEHFSATIRHQALAAGLVTLAFALLAHRIQAVNFSGALAGAAISFLLYCSSGPAGFAALAVLFLVTVGSTRLGRTRKHRLGIAEAKRGRNAQQVLANLVAAAALSVAALYTSLPELLLGAIAALAEAAADTASGEIGKALSDRVYLITSFRRVAVGADGGITLIGTLSGVIAGLLVALVAAWGQLIPAQWITAAAGAAAIGMFLDSVLGATLQRRGWLSNSGVNLVSTIAAAGIAIAFLL
jgi:uncharacterized protein (TIGR00297 family)